MSDKLINQLKGEYEVGDYATRKEIKDYVFEFLRGKSEQAKAHIWNKICKRG